MAKKPIAEIQLMPGQGGYYDPLSRIHLTTARPKAIVYSGTNCAQLRRSIKAGRIRLSWGSLENPKFRWHLVRKGDHYVLVPTDPNAAAKEIEIKTAESDKKEKEVAVSAVQAEEIKAEAKQETKAVKKAAAKKEVVKEEKAEAKAAEVKAKAAEAKAEKKETKKAPAAKKASKKK